MKKSILAAALTILLCLTLSCAYAEWKLPAALTQIADEAFMGDSDLGGTLHIPNGAVSIGARAFYRANLSAAVLPASVTQIGADAFAANPALIWVRVEGTAVQASPYALRDVPVVLAPAGSAVVPYLDTSYTVFCPLDQLYEQGGFYYQLPGDGTALLLCPVSAAAIPASITLPEKVNGAVLTDMTRHAFYGCAQLREINVTGVQTKVRNQALYACNRATVHRPRVEEIKLVSVPDRVDLYRNGGGDAYDLPLARVQLLNGAEIESVRAEGLEELGGMMISMGEADANGYVDIGLWGSYSPTDPQKSMLTGNHTVTLTLATAHDSLALDLPYCLHSEGARNVPYDWAGYSSDSFQVGETIILPKPVIRDEELPLAADRAWDYTLTIGDTGIIHLVSESATAYTLEAVAEGSTTMRLAWRKHLTNIGESYNWMATVRVANTESAEITDSWELQNIAALSVPLFADGSFEGVINVVYTDIAEPNQSADATLQYTLDQPGLVQRYDAQIDGDDRYQGRIRFTIGPAVQSGKTVLHLRLEKGSAIWTKDVTIITHADSQRSRLDYDLELPAVIYSGDTFLPRFVGRDADLLEYAYFLPEQGWDDDHTVHLPAGYYPYEWVAVLKELHYPLYNGSRYVDDLAQGRTLSTDPLATIYNDYIRGVIEVRDRANPMDDTPVLSAWQARWPSAPYSADIDKMDAQDPNWPWAEYPVTGYVKLPAYIDGVEVAPNITATMKDMDNFPFTSVQNGYATTNLYNTFAYTVDNYMNGSWQAEENLWAFTQHLQIDNRQQVPAGTYTCTMALDVEYAGNHLNMDVPMQVVVVAEAADIAAALADVPTTAKVGDVILALAHVEYMSSAVDDLYVSVDYTDPTVLLWNGKCLNPGTAHWYVWANYRNGEVRLAEGDITVTQ